MPNQSHAVAVARNFQIEGELTAVTPYGSGHINDTYCAVFNQAGLPVRFILQRINTHIFRNPIALMENVQRVTAHLAGKASTEPDRARRLLTLIAARDGQPLHVDEDGGYWRAYRFIEGAHSYDAVESTRQAYQAAKAFGQFQQQLVDLPAPPLHSTIPGFHDTPKRFAAFEHAAAADAFDRAGNARAETDFAFNHRSIAAMLLDANQPERVTHNDTKFNNVLLDDASGEAICVIDLDTVMPGLALYDFGDMVRTATSPAMEDERDLAKVTMQFPMFEALVRGYLSSADSFLTTAEKLHLPAAGKVIAFEQGIRFLTDYLSGDTYYKIHRDGHNLDRCRTQFKLIESIEQQEEQMHTLINGLVANRVDCREE